MEATAHREVDYQKLSFPFRRAAEQDEDRQIVHPVVVVGAGPIGLATAIDLAQQGIRVVLLDNDNTLSTGSRAICFAKRTLEIFDRLGCGKRMLEKGVRWNVGKVFLQDELIYTFDLLPESGHAYPAFINIQQYYVEGYLADRALTMSNLEIRWNNQVEAIEQTADTVSMRVSTPDGEYTVRAQYVVAADGSRSTIRKAMGLDSRGRVFKDRFLIADVKMKASFPTERWFWFDPPFHRNQSVLLHKQPDDVWRIDFQLGWDADPVAEKEPERVIPRVKALLGDDVEFELEWVSVYTFSCLRMDDFRHGRVLFAGDSAHGVSPFGARGANSGVQDGDNLAWKLKFVLDGTAPDALLDTYASERQFAAEENILNSTRATDFITPKSAISRVFRDATLKLAKDCAFARRVVNSGRLSLPSVLSDSPLNTPDAPNDTFSGAMALGAVCTDAPIAIDGRVRWFLETVAESAFAVVVFAAPGESAASYAQRLAGLRTDHVPVHGIVVMPSGEAVADPAPAGITAIEDIDGVLAQRFDARAGSCYLLRPDQHLCARWRAFDPADVRAAVQRAICQS
ncbi:FAD-dependent oxidoreductase [Burkholderia sp. Ac-20345]|uniref:FAD-dependent oxidoreductase n=1 Tax=Burkholderia sp. Ac-20345 TaxID=2703891 RepID=UPI00197BCC29|nr:FAD-dependent oxidoreductase [Burkholderia sp. Ac-20345]MBN3778654.1 FAD-dependent oxidoreductase [Burkholderia sp. Ac-20345]